MSAIIALSASLLLAAPALAQKAAGDCTDVHVFLAKGWNEQYNDQRQTKLVNAICGDLGSNVSCDYEDIILNNLSGSDYCTAVTDGTNAGKQQVQSYASKCPNSKLVLSGYSEGADVVGDIMAGGGGTYDGACTSTTPLDASSDAVCQIAAVMVFGNPRHVPNTAYNTDSGVAGTGQYPRTPEQISTLSSYAGRLHDWCNINDPVCANGLGTNDVTFHTNYFDLVTDDAASWAVSKINAASSCNKASSSSSSSMAMTSSKAAVSTVSASQKMMSTSSEAVMSSATMPVASSSAAASMSAPAGYSAPASYGNSASASASMPASYPMTTAAAANMTSMASYSSKAPVTSAAVTTMISGKPACVSYGVTTSLTTYGPYPAYPVSSAYPVTTSWIGWGNGTTPATMTSAMGTAAPSGTGAMKPSGTGASPYTGAAASVKVAGGLFAAVAGVVAVVMA